MDDREYAESVRVHMSWARNVCFEFLSEMVERIADLPDDGKFRANMFSAMLGVSVGTFRDAAVRLELARPAVVETIASFEVSRCAQRQCEHAQNEKAILDRVKDQVPS